MFGKFALNPSVAEITDHAERGAVVNAAWNGYNLINALGLGAAAAGWAAARFTETKSDNLSSVEQGLSVAKDALMGVSVFTGVLNGIQGGRLAKQAPAGRVPVETGTKPAPETPPEAAKIQRSQRITGVRPPGRATRRRRVRRSVRRGAHALSAASAARAGRTGRSVAAQVP